MEYLLSTFCFEPGALGGKEIAKFVRKDLGFEATRISADIPLKTRGKFNAKRHLAMLEAAAEVSALDLDTDTGEAGPSFSVATIGSWNLQTVSWKLSGYGQPSVSTVEELVSRPGFNAGYMADVDDTFWQSEERIETYELFGRSHDNLEKVEDPVFGGYKINTLKNPGARHIFPGLWLQAAWRMWFSGRAFAVIPKERLLLFQDAEEIRELESGVVFIQLYKHPGDYNLPESRRRQQAFRDWIGMTELAANAHNYAAASADPVFEIREGTFDRGGVRLVITWLDKDGNPTKRSQAIKKLVRELDSTGRTIWSQEVDSANVRSK